ncbi:50S ribosomal protein-like protein [Actinidia rufa]|uniref:50S ribosomal protein-like protein n=1 Tax=Actinidia rufa TaxID=165716 RepID=A0A7J0EEN0_9ERIC|nr:50S ribosomal protein-like protein [Actinidia rufa]
MATSTGRQALRSNRCRNVADNGLSDRGPPRRAAPPPQPSARKTPSPTSLPFSVALSSSGGGGDSDDETNKSFSLWLTAKSLFFFSGESAEEGGSGESSEWGNRLSPPAVAAEQHP